MKDDNSYKIITGEEDKNFIRSIIPWDEKEKEEGKRGGVEISIGQKKVDIRLKTTTGEEMDLTIEIDRGVPSLHLFNQHGNKESAIHIHKLLSGHEICLEGDSDGENVESSIYHKSKSIFIKDEEWKDDGGD